MQEIQDIIGANHSIPSISARLRDLRKLKFGSHTVNRRRRGDPKNGLFEYQLVLRTQTLIPPMPGTTVIPIPPGLGPR